MKISFSLNIVIIVFYFYNYAVANSIQYHNSYDIQRVQQSFLLEHQSVRIATNIQSPKYLAQKNNTGISISNNEILRNAQPFIIQGLISDGFNEIFSSLIYCIKKISEIPEKDRTQEDIKNYNYCERHIDARDYYFGRGPYTGHDALSMAIKEWNINTIRFNVNQSALNPTSKNFSADYVEELKTIVALARKKNLVVILALFDGRNKNAPDFLRIRNPRTPLDDMTTLRAAKQLASLFGQDPDIIFETLNEPWPPTSREQGWILWRDGGVVKNPRSEFNGKELVGVNRVIQAIRRTNAHNAIIVQAIGANFAGFPDGVIDPLNRIIYSAHPFLVKDDPADSDWYNLFGKFAQIHPFVMTAWNVKTKDPWCAAFGIEKASQYIQYIKDLKVGIIGYALDIDHSVTRDFRRYLTEPSVAPSKCTDNGIAGSLLKDYFIGQWKDLPTIFSIKNSRISK